MTLYVPEAFTPEERAVLRRYVTNVDGPVFALVNLPEVVKGALFARYSRSSKGLRRLFLDEFVADLDITGDEDVDATVGVERAEKLYERVFIEYGDDSVAQLGGVHLACEQASNLLTKALEWGRLASYLEQSTRYINYDQRLGGRYRYFRDPEVLRSSLATRYVGAMDRLFDTYAALLDDVTAHVRRSTARGVDEGDFAFRNAVRAQALDAVRGVLPAATQSNVGIYASGQAYEQLVLRLRAHPLPEARAYGELILAELRKVIPSFVRRVDLADRGRAWSDYLQRTREDVQSVAASLFEARDQPSPAGATSAASGAEPTVQLVDYDPDGETKLLTAMLYPYVSEPEWKIAARVERLSPTERVELVRAYVGDRANRRHKPGRALERTSYRFDVLADYGAFRDLQRHRMLTIEWQPFTPHHGAVLPPLLEEVGASGRFEEAMERSGELYEALAGPFPDQAAYAVCLAYRIRFSMQFNAREAMHLLELRTTPQGHPSYRAVAQEMHRLIAAEAGHLAVAEMMRFVDHSDPAALGRLDAEQRAAERRGHVVAHGDR